jgi:hypothetical protein
VSLGVDRQFTIPESGVVMVLKKSLLRRWIEFVRMYSQSRAWPYGCLLLTVALIVLQFTVYAHIHFLLVMLVVTLMAFERLAFTELLAEKDQTIEELKART